MKKLLMILLLFTVGYTASAQVANFRQTTANPTGAITNASVDTMNLTLTRGYAILTVQPIVTRLTGTMAGTAILYASLDGTNYVSTGDTLTLSNAVTNTGLFVVQKPAKYLRILVGGATTVTATAAAKIISGN